MGGTAQDRLSNKHFQNNRKTFIFDPLECAMGNTLKRSNLQHYGSVKIEIETADN